MKILVYLSERHILGEKNNIWMLIAEDYDILRKE